MALALKTPLGGGHDPAAALKQCAEVCIGPVGVYWIGIS